MKNQPPSVRRAPINERMYREETFKFVYKAARDEINTRIKQRDQILLVFLGAVGTIFGVSFGQSTNKEIMLTIPIIALGVSIILSQHNIAIGGLANFIRVELHNLFEEVPHWDGSHTLKNLSKHQLTKRGLSGIIIIITPCIISLAINYEHAISSPFPFGPIWWFSLIFTGLAAFYIMHAVNARSKYYNQSNWQKKSNDV